VVALLWHPVKDMFKSLGWMNDLVFSYSKKEIFKIEDNWMNDLMFCYTDKEMFKSLDDETITRRFQRLKTRRMQLPRATTTRLAT
jgi:hypothetical protein